MLRTLYRYLILETLPPFAVSLLAFTSIIFLGRLMRMTQMIVVKGIGILEVLKACFFLLPYLMIFTLPMAATVGILLAMTRLTEDHEVIAMKSAGLSFAQLAPPIVGFGVVMTLVTLGLSLYGSPWGQQAMRDLLREVVQRRADLGIKEQVFNDEFPGMMLFVNRMTAGGQMEGVFIYDSREMETPHTIYAKRGQLSYRQAQEAVFLQLYEGEVIRWGKEAGRLQTVEFKSYQVPLDIFGFLKGGGKTEKEMTLEELRAARATESVGSYNYNKASVELQQRFSLPLGTLLLCLIAMPLGLSPRHHGRTWSLVLGLVVFLVYYVILTGSLRLAAGARLNPSLAPWLPNAVFVWVAVYFWHRMVRELPLLPAVWPPLRKFIARMKLGPEAG